MKNEPEELRSGWVEHLVNAIAKVLGWPKRKRHFSGDWFEKDDGQGSVRSFRVERRLVGCPGSPEQTLPHCVSSSFQGWARSGQV